MTLQAYFSDLGDLGAHVQAPIGAFERVVKLSREVRAHGDRVFFVGNGGSAAIASHMTTDWLKNGKFAALCFNDGSQITCLANDLGYEQSFANPINAHGRRGDLLFAISSSGKSPNILAAAHAANQIGMHTVTLSGFRSDNPLRGMGDYNFYVPDMSYGYVEIAHLTILHAILDTIIEGDQ